MSVGPFEIIVGETGGVHRGFDTIAGGGFDTGSLVTTGLTPSLGAAVVQTNLDSIRVALIGDDILQDAFIQVTIPDFGDLIAAEANVFETHTGYSFWEWYIDHSAALALYAAWTPTEHLNIIFTTPVPPVPPAGFSATNFNCECECGPANKTLAAYRRDLLIRTGFASIASNPPPGTAVLMDAFLRDAQNFLYHKYPALHTRRFFRWSMEEQIRFYGLLDNDDSTQERLPVAFSADDDGVVSVTWAGFEAPPNGRAVFFSAPEGEKLPYGMLPDAIYYVVGAAEGASGIALTPAGTALTVQLGDDTNGVSHGYAEIRMAIFDLSPYKDIEGAWVEDTNGTWLPLASGIPPLFYTTVTQPSLPTRYEIRSCIEVFPAPNNSSYKLWIKGHFGLRPFELDGDKPTIDGNLVYLWALADALDYYGKPSAVNIRQQAADYLGQLVAGTHGSKRYVPGEMPLPPAVLPILAPYPGQSIS